MQNLAVDIKVENRAFIKYLGIKMFLILLPASSIYAHCILDPKISDWEVEEEILTSSHSPTDLSQHGEGHVTRVPV